MLRKVWSILKECEIYILPENPNRFKGVRRKVKWDRGREECKDMLTIYFMHPCQYFHLLVNKIPPNKTKTTLDIWPQCCGHLDRAWDKRRPALKNVFLALQTLLFWPKNYIKSFLTASVVSQDNPCYVAKHVTSYKVILYMTDSCSNHCVNRLFLFFSGSVWTFPREHCFL